MRRPLCLICLLYVFLIMFCMKFLLQKPEERLDNNQNNRFCGKVYRMEVKNNHPVIYLRNRKIHRKICLKMDLIIFKKAHQIISQKIHLVNQSGKI